MSSEKVCFIISPIGEPDSDIRKSADEKYDLIFKPVLEESGYKPIRADKESSSNSISRSIVTRLINSELVIADVTGYNANVFYELAIRNASKKPVIVIKEPDQKLPFDIYDKRAISIDMKNNRQWISAKEELKQHITSAIENPKSASESILSEYTFDLDAGKTPNIEQQMFLMMSDFKDELRALRNDMKRQNRPRISESARVLVGVGISIERGSGAGVPKDKNQKLLVPDPVTISRGEQVLWMNNDLIAHTITSGKPTDAQSGTIFDSGIIKAGDVFNFTFNEYGMFPYFDVIHPWITGTIIVQ